MGEFLSKFLPSRDHDVDCNDCKTENSSFTRILRRRTNLCYADTLDNDSSQYNFERSIKRVRCHRYTCFNKATERFSVEDVQFLIRFNLTDHSAPVILDTCITCSSNNVTILNCQILFSHPCGNLSVFKEFRSMQHFKTPMKKKLEEFLLDEENLNWILEGNSNREHFDFIFKGSIIVSPGERNSSQVDFLKMKLKNMPVCSSQQRLLLYGDHSKPDVELKVGERTFNAHKNVLSLKSIVFQDMFNAQTKENTESFVVINDANETAFEEVLYFMYTDTSPRIQDLAKDILPIADKYFIQKLKLMCEIELTKIVDLKNACELSNLAKAYNAENLFAFTTKYVTANVKSITKEGGWSKLKSLPKKTFSDLMNVVSKK